MKTNIPAIVKSLTTRLKTSSSNSVMSLFAASIIVGTGLTSCAGGPPISIGYRGAMIQIGGGGGQGRPRQNQGGQQYGYNGGNGGQYSGSGNYSLPQESHQVGERLGLEVFGNQPRKPVQGAVIVSWESVYGPHGPMINDKGSYALVERVPTGMQVYRYQNWTWKADCGNRCLYANPQQQPQQRQAYERPQQQGPRYCPPQPRYCPPPQPPCNQYGYRGGYQQRRGR